MNTFRLHLAHWTQEKPLNPALAYTWVGHPLLPRTPELTMDDVNHLLALGWSPTTAPDPAKPASFTLTVALPGMNETLTLSGTQNHEHEFAFFLDSSLLAADESYKPLLKVVFGVVLQHIARRVHVLSPAYMEGVSSSLSEIVER